MKLTDAKASVLAMIRRDLHASGAAVLVDPQSPDPRDPGKFMLGGMPARVVQHFSNWHPYISPDWFDELWSFPRIQGGEFYWYVFYIPAYGPFGVEHYLVCDFKQMRDWVIEFALAHPGCHRDHHDWMAHIQKIDGCGETLAYFRWGDEPLHGQSLPSRVVGLDNVAVLAEQEHHVGPRRLGGESEAHRLLKLYVAERPQLLGLSPAARPEVEHLFLTGDRVDVLFDNHGPRRSVVEIELSGEQNLEVGVHQAIKYRALAAAADRYTLLDPTVRAYVVAFETRYPRVEDLARAYDVRLVGVDGRQVLRRVA
jgi:hypothetical protein